ncbi:MAG: hypothetical protein P1U89_03185 [Verrucomicrobiales bacterium]|nr:hypothetical protein [Verrucomicrobiales bacterium]
MRLTAPSKLFFLISFVLFLLAVLGTFGVISFAYITYSLIAAWVVLALGCILRGV